MQQVLSDCRSVFDVGENVDEWAALALDPKINLHLIEPSEATFKRLLGREFSGNMRCNNFGIGSVSEDRKLYVFEEESGLNSLYMRHGLEDGWRLEPQRKTETIYLDTIDHYCDEHKIWNIDFLKIDVEWHELEVMKGAVGMLAEGRIKKSV